LRFILPRVKHGEGYAAYVKYASFLRIRAPCLRPFYEVVQYVSFYEIINNTNLKKSLTNISR
jgi:hypothetical protein